ncbi:helix-turn-helix domain-containing protein [Delftia tsuruhatensis]|uniref:hypothetical protein n=1 Tax=Delftia tsuruhatensis TaxID=180282 RepID=UPI002444502D|nr:hypothetical protein [Delftia tsuruhatensis]MDH0776356.1 helix-turn-helix domain-containing protein [Delftia tsuruhatensis]MDH1460089.1 helix-turn-helix domain-containing protein [Delftia tsuruhatensis]MDH1823052.1 helix-turn-helix domain-containing protein [Delftia tsuruhatensis]WGG12258.1 helix-turn-helix domain-containing protein [Delftia tsuruhatensis]
MNKTATQVIDALGGTAAVARIFGVRQPSVSFWKRDGIPEARVMFLHAVYRDALQGIDLATATAVRKNRTPRPLEA